MDGELKNTHLFSWRFSFEGRMMRVVAFRAFAALIVKSFSGLVKKNISGIQLRAYLSRIFSTTGHCNVCVWITYSDLAELMDERTV